MTPFGKFNYPFRYIPHPIIKDEVDKLISMIDSTPELHSLFKEGKMLGVLAAEKDGKVVFLRAFSGLAGGKAVVEGFVPPIFDTSCAEIDSSSHEESLELQDWLFRQYVVMNGLGETMSVKDIFAARGLVPPSGTGECAAPKLLNYAFRNGFKPLSFGEFWYGKSPESGEVREQGRFYPSCTGKCGPLLSWMLRGVDVEPNPLQIKFESSEIRIIYEDEAVLVADKPSGILCAPGLTGEKSLPEILEPEHGPLLECHRLDMDTSGCIIYAKTKSAQAEIRRQFEAREVQKTYLAHLCAGSRPWKGRKTGTIALPLAPDYYDRPRQMVDKENGKMAITGFEILQVFPDGEMDVRFAPKTGRTHQLRVHSASPLGLGRPIKGDALYGAPSDAPLQLRAESICFTHPLTGEKLRFTV